MSVRELMTDNPLVGRASMSLVEARELLDRLDIRHLPIVDDGGELVGILSERDLRRVPAVSGLAGDGAPVDPAGAGLAVAEVMSGAPLTVGPDDDLLEALDLLVEGRVGALPVVEPGTNVLLGILSYVDVLRGVRELFAGT